MLKRAREAVPTVVAVCCPPSGCGAYHVYIQLDKKNEGEPINAALGAISHGHPKLVAIVDKDIDVFNEEKVLWAIATRTQAGKDIQIWRGVRGSSLDPSLSGQTLEKDVLIIDATKKIGQPFAEPLQVPADIVRKVRERNLV
jgi:2,5-furandicarboxylate decarboxylase 1